MLMSHDTSVTRPIGIHSCKACFFTNVAIKFTVYPKGVRYDITNEALIGACFLPSGVGSMGS